AAWSDRVLAEGPVRRRLHAAGRAPLRRARAEPRRTLPRHLFGGPHAGDVLRPPRKSGRERLASVRRHLPPARQLARRSSTGRLKVMFSWTNCCERTSVKPRAASQARQQRWSDSGADATEWIPRVPTVAKQTLPTSP